MKPSERSDLRFDAPSWPRRLNWFWRRDDQLTLANLPDWLASLYGDRTALYPVDSALLPYPGLTGGPVSYAQLADTIARIAGGLASLDVGPGDRVALMTMNRVEMFLVALAVARLGAIPVPLNYMLRPDEIDAIVRRAEAEVVITDRMVFAGIIRDESNVPAVKRWVAIDDARDGVDSLLEASTTAAPAEAATVEGTAPAMVFFTSGTTGLPKGATLSHNAAVVGARYHGRLFALQPSMGEPLVLSVMPVAHVGGYAAMLTYLAIGWPILFYSQFDPEKVLDLIEGWKATAFTGTPAMYRLLLDAGAADRDLSTIRVWGGGADAFPDELVRRMRDTAARRGPLGLSRRPMFIRGYGMAEANSYVAQSPPMPVGDRCIGWVMPPVRYKIVDEAGEQVVPKGSPGELLLAGPTIATGYWNDEVESAAAFDDGWFRTGDIVRRGRGGLLYFVDRSRDVIKSGGYKIAAAEVDNVMEAHPAVLHSATVGVPHERLGEEVMTAVVLRPDPVAAEQELLRWARSHLAGNKCPRRIVFVESLPLTFSLKPKRREVRAMLSDPAIRDALAAAP